MTEQGAGAADGPRLTSTKPLVLRLGGLAFDVDARHEDLAQPLGVHRDLGRYYRLLEKELERVGLTEDELRLLCALIHPTTFDDENFDLLYGHVDKALHHAPEQAKKYRVDAEKLRREGSRARFA